MKLNELLKVVNEEEGVILFKLNDDIYTKYTLHKAIHHWWDYIYTHSELYDVISVYPDTCGIFGSIVIEVE